MQEATLAACHHPVARCDVLFNLSFPEASQEESKDMLSTEEILEGCSLFMFKTSAASTLVKMLQSHLFCPLPALLKAT